MEIHTQTETETDRELDKEKGSNYTVGIRNIIMEVQMVIIKNDLKLHLLSGYCFPYQTMVNISATLKSFELLYCC